MITRSPHSSAAFGFASLVLMMGLGLPANVHAQAFSCTSETSSQTNARAEGYAELLGDVVLDCTGGIPTPPNQMVPTVNISLNLDVNLTSKVTAVSNQVEFLESLLLVDEPNSPLNPTTPILNCGRTEAPDNTQAGAGVCSIVGGGALGAASTYNGTTNHPNVFQGRSFQLITGQLNQVVFAGIPIDPPGTLCAATIGAGSPDAPLNPGSTCHRIIRITNIRGDATAKGVIVPNVTQSINATLIANPFSGLPVDNITHPLATVQMSLFGPTVGAGSVLVQEGFTNAFKPRSLTQTLANGVARPTYAYSGSPNGIQGINYNQNVPGAAYDTESAFTDSLDSTHGDSPFNSLTGGAGNGVPLSNVGGFNTGINNAGIADSGTRFALQFFIPAGASVQVPQTVPLYDVITHAITGVMALTNTDSSGAGPFSPATGTLSGANNLAVYEVLFANPNALEAANIPVTLLNAPPNTKLQVVTSYAPFFIPLDAVRRTSATLPVPRFMYSNDLLCLIGACLNMSPNQGPNSGPISVAIFGDPILNNGQVKLSRAGFPDIPGTATSSSTPTLLTTTFDLTGAPAGPRDLVVTPQTGAPVAYPALFQIVTAPSCSYEVGVPFDAGLTVPASGGSGDLVVTPSPSTCAWGASTSTPWITLPPKSNSVTQPYIAEANSTGTARAGAITIAGRNIPVSQDVCTYDISPASQNVAVGGGSVAVNVTAPAGCQWSASFYTLFPAWTRISAGFSGSGNGTVTLQVDPNSGGPRSTTLTIFSAVAAVKTFAINQGSSTCGATDVSAQVSVVRGAFLSNFLGSSYTQQVKLTNNGPAIPGPVYLVVDGLVAGSVAPTARTTTCQSPGTSYMVLAAPNGLSAGQLVSLNLTFQPGAAAKGNPPSWTTLRVFSGTPSQ